MEFYENHGKLLNDSIYMICDISIKYIGIASIILQCLFLTFIERLLDTLKKKSQISFHSVHIQFNIEYEAQLYIHYSLIFDFVFNLL